MKNKLPLLLFTSVIIISTAFFLSQKKVEVVNYGQGEKDCFDVGKQIRSDEDSRIGNTFPNDDDHNNYVVYVSSHFNRRDNKCYVYYEDYRRASYIPNLSIRTRYSNHADEFWMSRLVDAYEGTKLIGCGAGTFALDDGCSYWAENSRNLGTAEDQNSEFNLKVKDYYLKN